MICCKFCIWLLLLVLVLLVLSIVLIFLYKGLEHDNFRLSQDLKKLKLELKLKSKGIKESKDFIDILEG